MGYDAPSFQTSISPLKPLFCSSKHSSFVSPAVRKRGFRTSVPRLPSQSSLVVLRISPSARQVDWNNLTPSHFDEKIANNDLAICLIGMSNCGKSHWSNELHRHQGFNLVCVDERIEHAIKPELSSLGYSGIDGLAAWMGFPSDEQFAVNQQKYLQLEESITAAAPVGPGNTVLDTTGSVCYLSDPTLRRLQSEYLVVHLEASDDMLDVMTESYFTTPKPVVWGNSFDQRDGETAEEALRRCYPGLLRGRRQRYKELAHLSVAAAKTLSRQLDLAGFLALVRSQMYTRSGA